MDLLEFSRNVAIKLEMRFSLYGNSLTLEEVFSEQGLFPLLVSKANQDCMECLGYGIGVSFEENGESTLGYKVLFDTVTPAVLKVIFLFNTLQELKEHEEEEISLDDLLYKFA